MISIAAFDVDTTVVPADFFLSAVIMASAIDR